jgi:hypothetical protein
MERTWKPREDLPEPIPEDLLPVNMPVLLSDGLSVPITLAFSSFKNSKVVPQIGLKDSLFIYAKQATRLVGTLGLLTLILLV